MENQTNNTNINLSTEVVSGGDEAMTQDYIDAINKLKNETVSRGQYDKLREENKKLLDTLVSGQQVQVQSNVSKRTAADIRADLFDGKDKSNLEYVTKALELRDAVLAEEGKDIFVSQGHNITPTQQDYDTAAKVAKIYQECIDYADGDSEAFTNELMRRTNEIKLPGRRK